MTLILISPVDANEQQVLEMLAEWKEHLLIHGGNNSPSIIFMKDVNDFAQYIESLQNLHPTEPGYVPYSTYFALDTDRNRLVGAINIRHELSPILLYAGGHIGHGVRPSERRRGYATRIISLGLSECEELGIDKVLVCCAKANIGSAKSIQRNGGELENEVEKDGELFQRYWIDLTLR